MPMAIPRNTCPPAGPASSGTSCLGRAEGYALDIISQTDLHFRPELLEGYACVALIGHDEYWSWEMRDAIDAYVERGGHVARFAGNFMWQIRLENEGRTQVCYKYIAREEDPLHARRPAPPRDRILGSARDRPARVPRPSGSTPRTASMPAGPAARRAVPRAFPSTGPSIGPSPTPGSIMATCWAPPRASSAMRSMACLTRSAAAFPILRIRRRRPTDSRSWRSAFPPPSRKAPPSFRAQLPRHRGRRICRLRPHWPQGCRGHRGHEARLQA